LRTIRLPRNSIVHPRDEVDWCASAGSACEENWYSSIAMVDEWNASVLSACFRSLLQFNCKLVRYCNIWLSCWTPLFCFPRCIPSCGLLTFSQVCGTLTEIGPWSLGRTSGTITVSVCEHCYVHFDDNIWFGLLDYFEKMSVALDFFLKVVIYLFIQLFRTPML
jgi:hypothetical protein